MVDPMSGDPDPVQPLLCAVRVVLVETSHPGNIGAAARAMKSMGMNGLWLSRCLTRELRANSALRSTRLHGWSKDPRQALYPTPRAGAATKSRRFLSQMSAGWRPIGDLAEQSS